MNTQKEIKLSSDWTNVGLYGGGLLVLIMTPVMALAMTAQKFHGGMLLGGALYMVLIGFMIYLFVYTCDARVIGDKIILKKQFRPSKAYSFDRIGYPTSFQLKSTKYIKVEMKNDDNSFEKYLIINSRSLLSFENKDAEYALRSLRNLAMKK